MKLVFATHNENKVKEVKSLLPKNFKILSLNDIGCFDEIPETSQTIEGNAHGELGNGEQGEGVITRQRTLNEFAHVYRLLSSDFDE